MTRPGLLQDADLGVAAEQDPDADGRGYLQTCPKPTQGRGYRVTFPRKGVTDVLGKGLSRVKVQVGAVSLWSGCGDNGVVGSSQNSYEFCSSGTPEPGRGLSAYER